MKSKITNVKMARMKQNLEIPQSTILGYKLLYTRVKVDFFKMFFFFTIDISVSKTLNKS